MLGWLIGGFVLAVLGVLITLVWWRMGDQWADEEHKRLPIKRTGPIGTQGPDAPRVVRMPSPAQPAHPERADDRTPNQPSRGAGDA